MAKDLSFLDEQAPDAVGNADLTRLRKLWLDERMSPELLAYDHDLVERVREMIRFQADSINMMLDDMRGNTENMDSAAVERRRMEIPILEMELDRVKYILTSYLRSRLKKLDKYVMHSLSDPMVVERLSDAEMQYAAGYVDMLGDTFQKSFLDHIPAQFQSLTEKEMIDTPNLSKYIVFRVKEHIGNFQSLEQDDEAFEIELDENDVVVGRYKAFRLLLEQNRIDLI